MTTGTTLPSLARRTRSTRADDLRDAVATVTPHDVRAIQPDLDGVVGILALPHSRLVFVRYGGAVVVEAPPTEDRVVATIPLGPMHVTIGPAARGRVHTDGFVLGRRDQTVMRPDPWAGALVLATDSQYLADQREAIAGEVAGARASHTSLRRADSTDLLTRACRRAWQAAAALPPTAPDSARVQVLRSIEEQLLLALVQCDDIPPASAPVPAPRRVEHLRAWLQENHGLDVALVDMAREVGVSVRQLQYAVAAQTGQTPLDLLREARLMHAHDLIVRSRAGGVTVAEIALASGFAHLGRFSATYAQRFGQTPSAAMKGRA